MPRKVQITVPSEETEMVIAYAKKLPGTGSIILQKEASVKPTGDVISVEGSNDAALELLAWCRSKGIGKKSTNSVSTSEPYSILSPDITKELNQEQNESSQEEQQAFLYKPIAPDLNTYMIMFGAGVFYGNGHHHRCNPHCACRLNTGPWLSSAFGGFLQSCPQNLRLEAGR